MEEKGGRAKRLITIKISNKMKKYKLSLVDFSIKEVEILRETESQVVLKIGSLREQKENKKSSMYYYLDTQEQAEKQRKVSVSEKINQHKKSIETIENEIYRLEELVK